MNAWTFKWLTEALVSDPKYYQVKGKVVRYDKMKPVANAIAGGVGGAIGGGIGGGGAVGAIAGGLGGVVGGHWGGTYTNKKYDERLTPALNKLGAKEISKDQYKTGKAAGNKMKFGDRNRIWRGKTQ